MEPDVAVRVRPTVIDVQLEHPRVRAVVPIAASDREPNIGHSPKVFSASPLLVSSTS